MSSTKPLGIDDGAPDMVVSDINLRILKACSLFAAKKDTRYYLQGVCLEIETRATTYIATDGHRFICYRDVHEPDARDNRYLGTFIIPLPHCKAFKLDKDDDDRASLREEHGRLRIAHNMTDITFVPIEGIYPHWRRVVPRATATGQLAQYDFKMLIDFKKFAEQLELPHPFLAPNGEAAAPLWFAGHSEVFGLIMPYRSQDQLRQAAPGWALRGGPAREQTDLEDDEFLRHPGEDDEDDGEGGASSGEGGATKTSGATTSNAVKASSHAAGLPASAVASAPVLNEAGADATHSCGEPGPQETVRPRSARALNPQGDPVATQDRGAAEAPSEAGPDHTGAAPAHQRSASSQDNERHFSGPAGAAGAAGENPATPSNPADDSRPAGRAPASDSSKAGGRLTPGAGAQSDRDADDLDGIPEFLRRDKDNRAPRMPPKTAMALEHITGPPP